MPAGDYKVRLFFVEHEVTAKGERIFDVTVRPAADQSQEEPAPGITERIDIFAEVGPNTILEKVVPVTLQDNGHAVVELTPVKGGISICGAMIEPVQD